MSYKKKTQKPKAPEELTGADMVELVDKQIERLKNNTNRYYFYVIDSKNVPSGSLAEIYEIARRLADTGHEVEMLHNEDDFVGVGDWLGERYASLPHRNTEKESVPLALGDILVIPEVFSNVIDQTKDSPCKRVVLLQSFQRACEFMPVSKQWGDFRLRDAIATSEAHAAMVRKMFPYMDVRVLRPAISPAFRDTGEPKEIGVNVYTRDPEMIHRIVKPFYWSHPEFKFVSFYQMRDLPRDTVADTIRKNPVTVWWDTDCGLGFSALEAMKSGSVVVGKKPDIIPDWMIDPETGVLRDNGVWVDTLPELYDALAEVLNAALVDEIPEELLSCMRETVEQYGEEEFNKNVDKVFNDLRQSRIAGLGKLRENLYYGEKNKEASAKSGEGKEEAR